MPRYIDADKLLADILDEKIINKSEGAHIALRHFEIMVNRMPTTDVVPKSEVERLQAELDSKQFRCDSCDRIMLTGAEHRACVKQAKAEVAREILEEIYDRLMTSFPTSSFIDAPCTTENRLYSMLSELKKKYTEDA